MHFKNVKVNFLTSFINPSFLIHVKNKFGLVKSMDYGQIIKSVEQVLKNDRFYNDNDKEIQDYPECKVSQAIKKSRDYILLQQNDDGHYIAEFEANTTLTSEYIMLLYFMDMADEGKIKRAAKYILSKQSPDGSWPIFYGGTGDISTTIEAYFALKLAGYDKFHPALSKARKFILCQGGIMKARVITKISLSFFGQYDRRGIPSMPVEIIMIPRLFSFNIYEFSSWARICVVPLTVLMELKPKIKIPRTATLDELYLVPRDEADFSFEKDDKNLISWHNFFLGADKILKMLEKSPIKISRKTAIKKAEKWILAHQDDSGDWGGIFPAKAFSVMALKSLGYDNDFPPIQKGIEAIERFHIKTDGYIHQQSCVSPIWDTAWSMLALAESGLPADHPSLKRSARWLYKKQTVKNGDWQVKCPAVKPGGWSFEYYNEYYPDTDDTSTVIMALKGIKNLSGIPTIDKLRKALEWLLSMHNTDGGWGAFDKDVNNPIYNKILFNDFKTMLDPSCPDITGRVLELLGNLGYKRGFLPIESALDYLKRVQHPDGPWFGRWGVNYIYGTWACLSGFAAIGEDCGQEYIQRAVNWLFDKQNTDGGWGECCDSYKYKEFMGKGKTTPSQTSWALIGLIDSGYSNDSRVKKGIEYLLNNQNEHGTWDEKEFTGTGFPNAFYIRYHMYKDYFPLLALSKYRKSVNK